MAVDPARAKSLFLNASDFEDLAERDAYLEDECGGDAELRNRVEALLRANNAAPLTPVSSGDSTGAHTPQPNDSPQLRTTDYRPRIETGQVIAGRYTLQEKIGEGGMGEVWVAKQSEPVKRRVALKLIKAGMDSKSVIQRFEQERQALAMMDHPNIAKILDGGLTEDRRLYFVMELVNGLALTKFCDEAKLTPRERLELFVPICQAVQHAHQKGIVHRDLKPSNILITMLDGRPVPKVIDFGVAKATGSKLSDESLSTQFGAVVGTLEYMSPEQAGFSGDDIDTRADIYSLGVILYEMLIGLKPIDAKRLRKAAFSEIVRIIQEEEPSKPSTRLSTDESLASLAALRQTEPKKLMALLRGELDWVVMKCLEKQRDRRYETANGLARDIQRYLADEMVEARPPSAGYRFHKFVKRNKGQIVAASLVVLALLVGIVGTSWGLFRANAETAKARRNADRAMNAEKESRIELGRTSAAAARLSAQRGEWDEALHHYRQALTLEPEDDIALRLGILGCYSSKYQYALYREELAGLVAREDLGKHRGDVRLQQAVEAMMSARKDADPVKLIREALELGLPPADEAFARALIAPTVPKVVEQLQQAARLDPYHRRTHDMLPGMLFLLGRIPEMREAVGRLRLIAPNATTTLMWQSYILILDDNLEAANAECERLRPDIGDDGVKVMRLMIRILHRMIQSEIVWEPDEKRLDLIGDLLGAAPAISRMFQDKSNPKGAELWSQLAMYRLPCFQAMADHPLFRNSGGVAQIMALAKPKAMNELASRLVETCPNGVFLWMQSTWLRGEGRLSEAEAALTRAVNTPSPFPIKRLALVDLTWTQFERLAKESPESQLQLKETIRVNLRDLVGRGTYPINVNLSLANIARGVGENALALAFSEAAARITKGDRATLHDRFTSETAFDSLEKAIATAKEMLVKTPNDVTLLNQRAVVEYRHGYFANAAASSFEVLRLDPKQPYARANLATIEMEVRRRQAIYGVLLEKLRLRAAFIQAHQGQYAEAVKAVVAEKAEGDTAVALACLYAVASSAAAADSKLTAEERGKRAEDYALKAIDLLRRGRESGYFKAKPSNFLDKERDFDLLRKRDDYKKLMGVEKQKPTNEKP